MLDWQIPGSSWFFNTPTFYTIFWMGVFFLGGRVKHSETSWYHFLFGTEYRENLKGKGLQQLALQGAKLATLIWWHWLAMVGVDRVGGWWLAGQVQVRTKRVVPRDVVHHEIAWTYFGCSGVFHIVFGHRWSNTSGYVHFASRIYPRCSWLGWERHLKVAVWTATWATVASGTHYTSSTADELVPYFSHLPRNGPCWSILRLSGLT